MRVEWGGGEVGEVERWRRGGEGESVVVRRAWEGAKEPERLTGKAPKAWQQALAIT